MYKTKINMSPSKKFYFQPFIIYFFLCALLLSSCEQKSSKTIDIRGVYGNPKPLWNKTLNLNDLGVNAIFVHSQSITHDMIEKARSEGAKVFAEFATLNGKSYVQAHPEAWAINDKGDKVQAASWFMGVCPTEPGFRKYRFKQLKDLLLEYDLDGVWMDYVHWHAQFEEPEPILPETCFCDHCLYTFSKDSGIEIPDGTTAQKADWILTNIDASWRDWRCKVIYDWTHEIKTIIKDIKPKALLGLYHCPWNDTEFDGARRRILGLDYNLLKKTIDVFSPMVYHARMGRSPDWVRDNILWFSNRLNTEQGHYPKIWPIVQAYDNPRKIAGKEFETVLNGGLSGNSSGVMMFTTSAIADNEDKIQVMKLVYNNLKEKAIK